MDGLFEHAARWGVETEYRDGFGNLRPVEPEVLARILEALAAGGGGAERILPRTIVVRGNADQALRLAGSEGEPLRWEILSEGKIAAGEATSAQLTLPALEDGVFRLRVTIARPEGDRSEDACLIVCGHRAYQGGQTAPGQLRALELAYQAFRRQGTAERHRAFDRFRKTRGSTLVRFACFEWLRRKYGHPWWEWPSAWRRAEDEKLAALRHTEAESIGLFEFVQWLAHDQLDRCRAKAQARGLPLGLYLDIAVGVCSDGFDAWCDQDAVLAGMAVCATPGAPNTAGRNRGVAGVKSARLGKRGGGTSFRYAGAPLGRRRGACLWHA